MTSRLKTIERLELEFHSTEDMRTTNFSKLRSLYETLATQLFQQFEPTKKVSRRVEREFMVRLDDWLELFENDEDRWIAFKSVQYIFFAGQQEFEELYRCAAETIIKPWLIDIAKLDLFAENAANALQQELDKTWPCPVTDSLRINGFLHLTGLAGQSLRPDWLSMTEFATAASIKDYQIKKNIKYLILLEDFSGSGGQICRTLKFAAKNFDGPIIVIPLIICAPGHRKIKETIEQLNLTTIYYKPVTILGDDCLVSERPFAGEPKLFSQLRPVLKSGYELMRTDLDGEEYGWKKIGSLVVMYSNCPNNTPPIFHHSTASWKPLFPRSERELRVKK